MNNISSIKQLIAYLLLLGVLIVLPFILLKLKDKYLKQLGFSVEESKRQGFIWLVSPFLIIVSGLFIFGSWKISQNLKSVNGFYLGGFIMAIVGISLLYLLLFHKLNKKTGRYTSRSKKWIYIIPLIITMLLSIPFLKISIYGYLDTHPFFTSTFLGKRSLF